MQHYDTDRTITVSAADPDGDTITYTLQSPPSFVSISGSIITISPTSGDAGTHTVTVRATANSLYDNETFRVIVTDDGGSNPNPAPGDGGSNPGQTPDPVTEPIPKHNCGAH